jgi:hypothetical protein
MKLLWKDWMVIQHIFVIKINERSSNVDNASNGIWRDDVAILFAITKIYWSKNDNLVRRCAET